LELLDNGELETPYEAAVRELKEETGLDASQYQLSDWQCSNIYEIYPHWRHRYAPGVTQNTEHIFGLELPAPLPVQLAADEHMRYEWLDWRAAAVKVFSWTNVAAIRELGKRYGKLL
ncbi:MAG TPA: dihydroneopterin triphosphate diphosphatase, partial [Methylophilaceae bacterium]|nr:dihydroneopterin triphosphate diphosphatase [Methylophilaceae bacterium]